MEGSGRGVFEILSQHLPGGAEEKSRKTSVKIASLRAGI
jgi:hypothetical protein